MIEAALALGIEAAAGYPASIDRSVGHPVRWIGAAIERLAQQLNRTELTERRRRLNGVATAALVTAAGAGFGLALQRLAGRSGGRLVLLALLATPGLAQRSLHDHVEAVRRPLLNGDFPAARVAVARVVGRDVDRLDETGVATAALESLAESFNDGVVAPAFWLAVGGLPGLYAYKAINTADSLIGHKEPRWRAFGWAAARLDDVANLVPARLAGALISLSAGRGWRTMWRDASNHASPNAGWPEAAMAGGLEVRLGGPVSYDGVVTDRPAFGAEGRPARAEDLTRGLATYRGACVLLAAGLLVLGLAVRRRTSSS